MPRKLNRAPVVDAVVDIRFESSLPPEAVFGVVWNLLKDRFLEHKPNPVAQIPEIFRGQDSNLQFAPHYKFISHDFVLQLGPKCLVFNQPQYSGWDDFLTHIMDICQKLDSELFLVFTRIGIRYVNFFEFDIFTDKRLKVSLKIAEEQTASQETVIRTVYSEDVVRTAVACRNFIKFHNKNGSIVDIDSFVETSEAIPRDLVQFRSLLDRVHGCLKTRFFGMLDEQFLIDLEPVRL